MAYTAFESAMGLQRNNLEVPYLMGLFQGWPTTYLDRYMKQYSTSEASL